MKIIKVLLSILFIIIGCLTLAAPLDVTPTMSFVVNIGGILLIVLGLFTFYQTLKKK